MHDISFIRQHPDAFDAALKRRGLPPQAADILAVDEKRRDALTRQGELQARRNALSKDIGMKKKAGEPADALIEEGNAINAEIKALDEELAQDDALQSMLASLPNMLDERVPDGGSEDDNIELRRHGSAPVFEFTPVAHYDLGETLGVMDFETAASVSGARFVMLRGTLARMERALAGFMLDMHTQEFGYEEIVPPVLVRDTAMFGTGQLPKFAEDSYRTECGRWLIPTAEVPLTNMVADQILDETALPLRYCAYTPCFRSEAGSAGKDTRGMIRHHQFSKVELVSITTPEAADAEHERITTMAEQVLQRLGLHYRVMELCAGDTGFSATRTFDIEVWFPAQSCFREISSCSHFGAFQARRMKARYRRQGEKKPQFVHTLNGSALAIGRLMAVIIEQYQQADGSVHIPDALVPYMGGLTTL